MNAATLLLLEQYAELPRRYVTQSDVAALLEERNELLDALKELMEWEARMGGFEAPAWFEARDAINRADGSYTPADDTISDAELFEGVHARFAALPAKKGFRAAATQTKRVSGQPGAKSDQRRERPK